MCSPVTFYLLLMVDRQISPSNCGYMFFDFPPRLKFGINSSQMHIGMTYTLLGSSPLTLPLIYMTRERVDMTQWLEHRTFTATDMNVCNECKCK